MPAPCLLIAPQGLTVTGVTTWIAQTAEGFAARHRPVGVLVHGGLRGHHALAIDLPEACRVFTIDAPPIDDLKGDLSALIPAYARAARDMRTGGEPVVLVPARHGDCFAACCALTMTDPDAVRVLGLQHIDAAYEDAVIDRYEPVLARLAGVSTRVVQRLRERHPSREVTHLPNAVAVPDDLPRREPVGGRPLRLLYTGRIEHEQKRVCSLMCMSRALTERGCAHELTLLGDGPAEADIDGAGLEAVRRLPPVPPAEVTAHLDRADLLVMASRTEGLSISLLEAMARGCAAVVTRTPSGAAEAIEDGVSGVLTPNEPTMSDEEIGEGLADGVERALAIGLDRLGNAAQARVRERFNLEDRIDATARLVDACAAEPGRVWPADRAVAFSSRSAGGEGSGSVPPGGAEKFARVLGSLAGRAVAIHGVGQHTRQLAGVLADTPATIVGFTDDDPRSHGTTLFGWPVVAPADVHTLGATELVISSAMHEAAIYGRRAVYEGQGLSVHRVYQSEPRS